jgi:hypothetical protein
VLGRVTNWLLDRLFAFGTRERILNVAFMGILVIFFIALLVYAGPSALSSILRMHFDPTFDAKAIAGSAVKIIVLVSVALAVAKLKPAREALGLFALIVLRLTLQALTSAAVWVLKHRVLTTPIAILSLLVAASFGSVAVAHEKSNAALRAEGAAYISELRRFVERRPISNLSTPYAESLHALHVRFSQQPLLSIERFEGCDHQLARSIDTVFLNSPAGTSGAREATETIVRSIESGATKEQDLDCNGNPLSRAYYRLWLARLFLTRSQQGLLLSRVIRAHTLLNNAALGFPAGSAAVENSLGNVYSFYLVNFDALVSNYAWDSVTIVPQPGKPLGRVHFFELINEAQRHMVRAKELESANDSSFATVRMENNTGELKRLLLQRRTKPYMATDADGNDPLAAIDEPLFSELHELRARPLDWLAKEKKRLRDSLIGQQVPEGFVTLAQLGCLEMDIVASNERMAQPATHVPVLTSPTPLEAMKVAIYMGFRDPDFFLNQHFRGMCPLLQSPDGPDYVRLVTTHLGIEESIIRSTCGL